MKILVTGAAGFIGAALSLRLLERGDEVVGVDNLNDYYDVTLKHARLARLTPHKNFKFVQLNIAERDAMEQLFTTEKVQCVVNLAAQAGVRYSITNPHVYAESNLVGFLNILEGCRNHHIEHLIYASSSSVYGANAKLPFSTEDKVDNPVSLYAATKKANELMAHSYSHLYDFATTGLRFFTVYGEWGRPDMSPFIFARQILADKPIDLFNYGNHRRDFTYIDDIVEGILRVIDKSPTAKYRVYNIGNSQPEQLLTFVETLEKHLGKTAIKNLLPIQPGDVQDTYADISDLMRDFDYSPKTSLDTGIEKFVTWYKTFHEN
ncbi:MAG: NAD-dependent epimerase [Methylococcales bacterium]|nr:NAD-dependent epimerase [Methylococcales bacterium]MDD5753530.1 NAD-dependent epimerase [Methylococcales bacterium]